MIAQEQIEQQVALLETHRRTLQFALVEQAKFGAGYVPPLLHHQAFEARVGIRQCKLALRGWGVIVADLPDDEPSPAVPAASMSEQAGVGITAMAGLLDAPDVRSIVESFRESFEIVCREIDRLSTYKDLHDLLHDLQFNCYNPILRGARDFPSNQLFVDSLTDYAAELRTIVNGLWEVAERAALSANERGWIAQIDQAAERLADAIEHLSKSALDRVTLQVGRVLYIHPARINERLKEAARDLPLDSLIKAMAAVRQRAVALDQAGETLAQVDQGIAALEQLGRSLSRLIGDHDTWQDIDLELHRVEENFDRHLAEFDWFWPDLKLRVLPLCDGRADRWSRDLTQAAERLDTALAARDAGRITAAFRLYRRQAGLCFFQADKQLKDLCRTLRQVDGPLHSIVRILA